MDLNLEYAAHQRALMDAGLAPNDGERLAKLGNAARIAERISEFQRGLGAAAAGAWRKAQSANPAHSKAWPEPAI